mmetsp:Transcript_65216/g.147086  ORF Transcript_65216/g.147086 Transcript_65216/m.147086 type:complete len:89 (+) Transcript_65216:88-354(+)
MSEAFAQALSAALGGIASTVLLFPLDTIKTQMQAARNSEQVTNRGEVASGTVATATKIIREGGVSALFSGVIPGTCQSATEKAIYFYG